MNEQLIDAAETKWLEAEEKLEEAQQNDEIVTGRFTGMVIPGTDITVRHAGTGQGAAVHSPCCTT